MEEFGHMLVKLESSSGEIKFYIVNIFKCLSTPKDSYYEFRNTTYLKVSHANLFTRDGASDWCKQKGFELIHYKRNAII